MVHKVSPGMTVCATAARAFDGMAAAKATVSGAMMRRTRGTSWVVCCSTAHVARILPPPGVMGGLTWSCSLGCTRAWQALADGFGGPPAVPPEVALVRAQRAPVEPGAPSLGARAAAV